MVICMSLWTVKSHCSHMLGLQIMQWVVPLPHNDSGPFSLHPNLDEGGQFFFLLTRRSSVSLPAENLQWEQIFHVLIQSCVLKTHFQMRFSLKCNFHTPCCYVVGTKTIRLSPHWGEGLDSNTNIHNVNHIRGLSSIFCSISLKTLTELKKKI